MTGDASQSIASDSDGASRTWPLLKLAAIVLVIVCSFNVGFLVAQPRVLRSLLYSSATPSLHGTNRANVTGASSTKRHLPLTKRPSLSSNQKEDVSGCADSLSTTGGLICMSNNAWGRVLKEERRAWADVVRGVHWSGGERRRSMPGGGLYKQVAENGEHFIRRRDYLQSVWIPTLSCPEESRVGLAGDGGKWVCSVSHVGARTQEESLDESIKCLIYSFGSNNEFSFEEQMQRRVGGKCEIHVFDHTAKPDWRPPTHMGVHLHSWGVVGRNSSLISSSRSSRRMISFDGIVRELKHAGRPIDVVKIDVDGAEFEVLPDILSASNPPRQILVEVHLSGPPRLMVREADNLLFAFRNASYYMFHAEANYNDPLNANEYSFIRVL